MKKALLTFWALFFLASPTGLANADPFYYDPYRAAYYGDFAPSDPYHLLHLIHYQLYRRSYYPFYPVSTVQVLVFPPPAREIRTGEQARKR